MPENNHNSLVVNVVSAAEYEDLVAHDALAANEVYMMPQDNPILVPGTGIRFDEDIEENTLTIAADLPDIEITDDIISDPTSSDLPTAAAVVDYINSLDRREVSY